MSHKIYRITRVYDINRRREEHDDMHAMYTSVQTYIDLNPSYEYMEVYLEDDGLYHAVPLGDLDKYIVLCEKFGDEVMLYAVPQKNDNDTDLLELIGAKAPEPYTVVFRRVKLY